MNPYYKDSYREGEHLMTCPHCNIKSLNIRAVLSILINKEELLDIRAKINNNWNFVLSFLKDSNVSLTKSPLSNSCVVQNTCPACKKFSYDISEHIDQKEQPDETYSFIRIYPQTTPQDIDPPNEDMSEECKEIYQEAAIVFSASPRASAVLMRLCLQKFLNEQDVLGRNINDQIKRLRSGGFPHFVIQYMDVCRVVGNSGAHPLEMDVNENEDLAKALFLSINTIVDELVSIPKRAQELSDRLPASALRAIEKRDNQSIIPPNSPDSSQNNTFQQK